MARLKRTRSRWRIRRSPEVERLLLAPFLASGLPICTRLLRDMHRALSRRPWLTSTL